MAIAPDAIELPSARLLAKGRAQLERELGSSNPSDPGLGGLFTTFEETPELQWPNNVIVFDRMRRTDAQVRAVLNAMALPIRRTRWSLVGSDVRPEVMELCRRELGLFPPERGRITVPWSGVVWDDFLRHALLHVPLGFMAFEQVYKVGPPGPGLERLGNRDIAHIRKLAPRLPRRIHSVEVERDGGLKGIKQVVRKAGGGGGYGWETEEVLIPVESLVVLVNDQEGSDWYGNSILRSSFKSWFIKDGLERIGPLVAERNGMGVPVVNYTNPDDRALALAISKGVRAGEDAGVALPTTMTLELLGVVGSLKDELPLLKYHNEQIGRNALAMLLDLGHDAGARSLGDTFLTFFLMALDGIAEYVASTVTRHVLADLVRLNFGEGETYPYLKADAIQATSSPTADAIERLVSAGVIIPDEDLETHERRRYGLPLRPGLPTEPLSDQVEGIYEVPAGPPQPELPPAEDPEPPDPEEAEAMGLTPDELAKLVNAAAILIRSGFSPEASLEAMGLDPIDHLGLLPVTVQKPEEPVAGLSAPTPAQAARALVQASSSRRSGRSRAGQGSLDDLEKRIATARRKIAARRRADGAED